MDVYRVTEDNKQKKNGGYTKQVYPYERKKNQVRMQFNGRPKTIYKTLKIAINDTTTRFWALKNHGKFIS